MSCPDCVHGAIHDGEPTGHEEKLHGLDCYVADPPSGRPKAVVLFLTDVFGWKFHNSRLLADEYARKAQYRVVIPDVIPGGGASPSLMDTRNSLRKPLPFWDIWGWLKKAGTILYLVFLLIPFMVRTRPVKVTPIIYPFAHALRASTPLSTPLFVCGFCWGGLYSTTICAEIFTPEGSTTARPLVDCSFNAHPSRLKLPDMVVDAVQKYKVPWSLATATEDSRLKPKDVEHLKGALEALGEGSKDRWEVRSYDGVPHGFAVRAEPGDKVQEKCREEAVEQALGWFKRWEGKGEGELEDS